MAVKLILVDCLHAILDHLRVLGIIGHAIAHLDGHVLDNLIVRSLDLLELSDDNVKVLKKLLVLLLTLMELPTILLHGVVELAKKRDLLVQGKSHVVLNSIQTTENKVEEGNGDKKLMVKLLDDGRKAAARHVQVAEAFLQLGGLGAGITLVDRIVPDLPGEDIRSCR